MNADSELLILQNIHHLLSQNPNATQRDFAQKINFSLGMTNLILKRLNTKGLIVMQKISSRHIIYSISSAGMDELLERSQRHMKKSVHNAANYKDTLIDYLESAQSRGYTNVLLVGESDVQFIIEYACKKLELQFASCEPSDRFDCGEDTLVLYADTAECETTPGAPNNVSAVAVYDVLAG